MGVTAAIDCGTHSTRLLVNKSTSSPTQSKTLERRVTITNLGEGLSASGRLKPAAIERTCRCLQGYVELMQAHRVEQFRIVATSAARDADNSEEFLAAVAQVVGQVPELLSGEAEAAVAFKGAISQLKPESGPYLICDIGGGSTEFAFGSRQCEGIWSADVGSSRLTQQYIANDPPLPEELTACLSVVELHLDDLLRAVPSVRQARQLVGLAGTVTTAAAVEIGLEKYDPQIVHHFSLSKSAAEDVFRTLATENRQQRLSNPGLHPDRVDVIVAGLCILVKTMRYLEFDSCLVSESDLLDGVISEIDEQH